MNFAATAALICLIGAAICNSQVMRILFLVFNAIFVLAMAIMIGLIYADKLEEPTSFEMKAKHLHGVLCFSYMFLGAILELIVLFAG